MLYAEPMANQLPGWWPAVRGEDAMDLRDQIRAAVLRAL
jgi:hypothetical protein